MNPYLMTGLAMCVIVLIALAGTAWLAVHFNRRGKEDLRLALEPLAASIDGTVNVDEAEVAGRRGRWPVYGRMANASEGPGRVFQVEVVDAAGGEGWRYTSNPRRKEQPRTVEFVGDPAVRERVEPLIDTGIRTVVDPDHERFRIEYMVDKGTVQLVRAMQTRRDIPDAEVFAAEVDLLTAIAEANRALTEAREDEVSR